MNAWIVLLMNVAVGSVIGGVTNELAIRMLFRPHKPWKIGGWRVPFTPGLIPRRRDEIAVQMGRLVEEHLLTTEGIKRALARSGMENTLNAWLTGLADRWYADDRPLREFLHAAAPGLLTDDGGVSDSVRLPLQRRWQAFVDGLIHYYEQKRLRDLIPAEGMVRIDAALGDVGRLLLERFRAYLHSPDGQQAVQQMLRGLLGGGGGMFGGLVGMFLADEKIAGKLLPYLDDLLAHPELADRLNRFLRQEADKWLDKTVREIVDWLGAEQVEAWSAALFAKLEEQSVRLLDKPPGHLLSPLRETVVGQLIPRLARWMVETVEQNVERLLHKLSVRDIVTRQVEGFPIERIEEMIVGISGREFRMITILGFILGGIIGLVQGLLAALWG
jgi:uncharacterized membrane protein YheB (UPF0754 family)